jgi:hypothetical protein
MKPPTEKQAVSRIVELLGDLLGGSLTEVQLQHVGVTDPRYDYAISVNSRRFIAEYKSNASTGAVASAIDSLNRFSETSAVATLPLVIVPFMGLVGRQLCDKSQMSWLDLCGNAKIVAPGLRIWIEGRPNQYRDRGRPPNVFAPKSSRIARQLLLHAKQFQTQANLSRQTGLGDGYVSKIVRRLEHEQYIDANKEGAVRPRDPNLLLDAWHDVYDFNHHRIIKGHVPARTGDELLKRVVNELGHEKLDWAVTGLGAAWLYTSFAAFRLATVYLSSMPSRDLLREIEFSDEPKGANLWLVLPDDEGVFQARQEQGGIQCVSALQAYLDLKGHPERAKDAAVELRRTLLQWEQHAT